jgi:drug/metabolite transporter (DMT)-like permease
VVTFFLGALIFHDRNLKRKTAALLLLLTGAAILAFAK